MNYYVEASALKNQSTHERPCETINAETTLEDLHRPLEVEIGQTAQGGLIAVAEFAIHADAEADLFPGHDLRSEHHTWYVSGADEKKGIR